MSMFADPIKGHARLGAKEEPVLLMGFVVFPGQGLLGATVSAIVVRKDGSIDAISLADVSLDWRLGEDGKWDDMDGETIEEIDADGA